METCLNKIELNFKEKLYVFSDEIKHQIVFDKELELINFKEFFGNDNPVNIEIGMGNGEFLVYYASKNLNENYIGFEVNKKVFSKAIKKCEKRALKNVRLVHYDAAFFVKLLPDNSIKNFYINFPDPWPKKRHHKRRLLKKEFLEELSDKLIKDGHIYIATDHNDYGKEIASNLKQVKSLVSCFHKEYETDLIDYYETKYYKKFAIPGKIFFFKLRKV
jgi:tRNA (guanine-N7-)-methyltransferase